MARQASRSGGNRSSGNQDEFTNNEATSLQQKLKFVLSQIVVRQEEIAAVLPPDLPFERFHATINQALRNNPEILNCTGVSIVNACVKSAYDGLRLDGKEAALVAHNVKVSKSPERWESHAEYFPMVRGLIKKILSAREVVSIEANVIHEHDTYRVLRGTNPDIHHEPRLIGDRGRAIAFYSVARLKNGFTTSEIMTLAEVEDVRAEAKTKYVWDRWPSEMGKKSVIRRHEKKLPSGRDMIDVEAREMFPQFDRTQPHPQFAQIEGGAPSPRPTRAAIQDQSDTAFGVPIESTSRDQQRQTVDHQREDPRDQDRRENPRDQERNQAHDTGRNPDRNPESRVELPEDPAAWATWSKSVEAAIAKAPDADAVDAVWREANETLKHATPAIRSHLTAAVTKRNTDLALGETDDGDPAA